MRNSISIGSNTLHVTARELAGGTTQVLLSPDPSTSWTGNEWNQAYDRIETFCTQAGNCDCERAPDIRQVSLRFSNIGAQQIDSYLSRLETYVRQGAMTQTAGAGGGPPGSEAVLG